MVSVKSTSKLATPILDDQLCFAIYAAGLAMNKVYRHLLGKLALTYPQYLVMLVLWETPDMTVSAIGERLYLDSATLTPLLKRLETGGFVTRQRSRDDERQVIVSLTEHGRKLRCKAADVQSRVGCAVGCSPAQSRRLTEDLRHLRDRLTEAE